MMVDTEKPGASVRLPGEAASLRRIREFVRSVAGSVAAEESWIGDLVLAVDEACQNVVRHAYGGEAGGDIIVETGLEIGNDGISALVVTLIDFASPVDPVTIMARPPVATATLRPGGLGVGFIRMLTDESGYVTPPPGAGNALRLLKRLPGGGGRTNNKGQSTRKG